MGINKEKQNKKSRLENKCSNQPLIFEEEKTTIPKETYRQSKLNGYCYGSYDYGAVFSLGLGS